MKTKRFFSAVAVACAVAGLATMGCANNSSARKAKGANGTLVLNLYDTSGGVDWTDTLSASREGCSGGYWRKTYDEDVDSLRFGSFVLPHVAGYSGTFWGGFTIGTNGDDLNYILPCEVQPCYEDTTHLASQGWICNQWGVTAGGGIKTVVDDSVTETAKKIPYLIAYQGTQLNVHLAGDTLFEPVGVFISNHPWPYYGNRQGDGFARPLNRPGDYFTLTIKGYYADGELVDELVVDTLAKYDPAAPDSVWELKNWHWVDLSKIGSDVATLRFSLQTTDTGQYGPNTAFYFCMDKLTVIKADAVVSPAAARQVVAKKAKEPLIRKREFTDYLTLNVHRGGEAMIYDTAGKTVLKATLKVGENKVDTRKLPAGEYLLSLHHHTIHLVKK